MVTLVKRYIDTFSPQELDIIAAYIDDKIENAPLESIGFVEDEEVPAPEITDKAEPEEPEHECCDGKEEGCCQNVSDNPAWVDMFAADNGGEAALDGEYYIVTKDDKPIFKITKPKGKKVLETLDPHGIG
jgi:hypothetical protein